MIWYTYFRLTIYRFTRFKFKLVLDKWICCIGQVNQSWPTFRLHQVRDCDVVGPDVKLESTRTNKAAEYSASVHAYAHVHLFLVLLIKLLEEHIKKSTSWTTCTIINQIISDAAGSVFKPKNQTEMSKAKQNRLFLKNNRFSVFTFFNFFL